MLMYKQSSYIKSSCVGLGLVEGEKGNDCAINSTSDELFDVLIFRGSIHNHTIRRICVAIIIFQVPSLVK
jgi:hypothetical protein